MTWQVERLELTRTISKDEGTCAKPSAGSEDERPILCHVDMSQLLTVHANAAQSGYWCSSSLPLLQVEKDRQHLTRHRVDEVPLAV